MVAETLVFARNAPVDKHQNALHVETCLVAPGRGLGARPARLGRSASEPFSMAIGFVGVWGLMHLMRGAICSTPRSVLSCWRAGHDRRRLTRHR